MSKITTGGYTERRIEQTVSLKASAELKRIRNDAASERAHLRIMKKLEHEFDGSGGQGGILKRGLARIHGNSLSVPAERKRQLRLATSGRSFHGTGTIYRKECLTATDNGRKQAASSGAAHYRYIADAKHDDAMAAASTGSHVSYIDGSRVEKTVDGERLDRSNIEGDFNDRMRLFALAEQFERHAHGDKISFDLNRASLERAAATADPACDSAVRAAVEQHPLPHNGKSIKIQLKGNNQDLRHHLAKHGLDLSKAKTNDLRMAKDGIAFHSERSGRTHFRWVFELPVEFSAKQREHVLDGLCARMDELKCMYAAVIHAPDPGNDERNYHLHLIFYDRPCRRLDGTEADFENVAETFKDPIRKEIAAGDIKPGEWDFAVQRHYKSIRTWKTHYPFRANKSREVTKGKDWQARFRRDYAAIVNKVSADAGGPAVYDPRSYTDRRVDISPSKHLGQLHKSEVAGIPTLIGLSNERNQADDQRRAIHAWHEAELARLSVLDLKLAPYKPSETVDTRVSNWAAKPLDDLAESRLAADAKLAMDLWLLETARERSRGVLVRDRQRRAAERGTAREQKVRKNLANAAETYLAKLDRQDAELQRVVADVQQNISCTPSVNDESVNRTALNCKALQRQYTVTARQTGSEPKIAAVSSGLQTVINKLEPKALAVPPLQPEPIEVYRAYKPESENTREIPSKQAQDTAATRQPSAALAEPVVMQGGSPPAPIMVTKPEAKTRKLLNVPPLPVVPTLTPVSQPGEKAGIGERGTGGSVNKPYIDGVGPLPESSSNSQTGGDEPSIDASINSPSRLLKKAKAWP